MPTVKPSQAALARTLGISRQAVQKYLKAGYTHDQITTLVNANKLLKNQTTLPDDLIELKKLKLQTEITHKQTQTQKEKIRIDREKKALLPLPQLEELLIHIAAITKAAITNLESKLPPLLEGLTASQMTPILKKELAETLSTIAQETTNSTTPITH